MITNQIYKMIWMNGSDCSAQPEYKKKNKSKTQIKRTKDLINI